MPTMFSRAIKFGLDNPAGVIGGGVGLGIGAPIGAGIGALSSSDRNTGTGTMLGAALGAATAGGAAFFGAKRLINKTNTKGWFKGLSERTPDDLAISKPWMEQYGSSAMKRAGISDIEENLL
jgi:hypothetical protein